MFRSEISEQANATKYYVVQGTVPSILYHITQHSFEGLSRICKMRRILTVAVFEIWSRSFGPEPAF